MTEDIIAVRNLHPDDYDALNAVSTAAYDRVGAKVWARQQIGKLVRQGPQGQPAQPAPERRPDHPLTDALPLQPRQMPQM